MEKISTFDQLPEAVNQLFTKLDSLEQLIKTNQSLNNEEELLSIEQAATFLNLSKATLYSKVSKGELPFMKQSKRLYFSKKELVQYIKSGSKKTLAQIADNSEQFLKVPK